MRFAKISAILALMVLLSGCAEEPSSEIHAPAGPPKPDDKPVSTWEAVRPAWSASVNGLQFKVEVRKNVLRQGEKIPFTIYLKNVGNKGIAVLDPAKLPEAEGSIVYYSSLFDKKRTTDYTKMYRVELALTYEPEWYTVLKPNDTISGALLVKHDAPIGKHYLVVAPYMVKPRGNMEGERWKKADFDRLSAIAWTNWDECREAKKRVPEIGPFEIEIR